MTPAAIDEAVRLAREFVRLADELREIQRNGVRWNHETRQEEHVDAWAERWGLSGSARTGELRRRSMDLTRALAAMRRA